MSGDRTNGHHGDVAAGAAGEPSSVTAELVASLAGVPRLLVATDFDGVLAPIVADPEAAAPLPASMEALAALRGTADTTVAIVSGRERRSLRSLVPAPERFVLVGSHGAELGDVELSDEQGRVLAAMVADLRALAGATPGLFVESKALSVAVHFRRVDEGRRAEAAAAVDELRASWPAKVVTGKEVVEFALVTATKGDAIRTLVAEHRISATVYLGDDVTDEDAFGVLGPGDVGIKVGPGPTAATHRVDTPEDVSAFLVGLADLR